MRILITSKAGAGHAGPLLPFAHAFRRTGASVLVAAPRDASALITGAGLPYHPLPDPPAERDAVFGALDGLSHEEAGLRVMREVFAGIDTTSALPGTLRALADYHPDIVLRDPTEFAGLLAAERFRVPHGRIAIMSAAMETWGVPVVAGVLDDHRKRLGLRPDPHGHAILDSPYLTVIPEAMETPEDPGPAHASRFRESDPGAPPLPDYWDGDERPLVYVTYGSVTPAMPGFPELFRATVAALADLPVRALFTIGAGTDRAALGPVPPNVHVEPWVPQAAVMPHAAAMVSHGGSGTTRMALAAGVPNVVVPGFADQPRNAERVAELGAGIALPEWREGVAGIGDAVRRVLSDPSYRLAAERVAAEVAALPPIDDAMAVLGDWLELARAA